MPVKQREFLLKLLLITFPRKLNDDEATDMAIVTVRPRGESVLRVINCITAKTLLDDRVRTWPYHIRLVARPQRHLFFARCYISFTASHASSVLSRLCRLKALSQLDIDFHASTIRLTLTYGYTIASFILKC